MTMKRPVILLFLLFFCTAGTFSQGTLELTLMLKDEKMKTLAGEPVTFTETSTGEVKKGKTDVSGRLKIKINSGKHWRISVRSIRNYKVVEVPDEGVRQQTMDVVYSPKLFELKERAQIDRSSIPFTEEFQEHSFFDKLEDSTAMINIQLYTKSRQRLTNYDVTLTCLELQKKFRAKTDRKGSVFLMVPVGQKYDVDVGDMNCIYFIEVSKEPNQRLQKAIIYEPADVRETVVNDTITQKVAQYPSTSSDRWYVSITVKGQDGKYLPDEDVFLAVIGDSAVYHAKTDRTGEARFLLPLRKKYMIHFRFRPDVDVIDLSDKVSMGRSRMTLTYIPLAKYANPETYIPTPEDLYVKTFTSFLHQQLDPPEEGHSVGMEVKWGNNKVNKLSRQAVMQIAFSSAASNDYSNTPPINISLVIDKSGSMAGYERIDQLKPAIIEFIKGLREDDMVSLVVFDDEAQMLLSPRKVGTGAELTRHIEKIEAGGGTNIYKGLKTGYGLVMQNFHKNKTNRVVLLTDGYGSTRVATILQMSRGYNEKGIECSAVGVGTNFNYALLSQLATFGGGLIHFVPESGKINTAFVKELTSVLFPVARDLKLEIEYNKKIILSQLFDYKYNQEKDNAVVKLKNCYSGLQQMAIAKFLLEKIDKKIEGEPVIVRLTYYDLLHKKKQQIEEKMFLEWTEENGELERIIDQRQKKLYAIAVMNRALKVMAESFAAGNFKKARQTIDETIADVKKTFPESSDSDVAELMEKLMDYVDIIVRTRLQK